MSQKKLRKMRHFSPTLRIEVVAKVEKNQLSVAAAAREYGISPTTVYQWIHKYSTYNKAGTVVMIDKTKRAEQLKALNDRIAELERVVGLKQMEIDFLSKHNQIMSGMLPTKSDKKKANSKQ